MTSVHYQKGKKVIPLCKSLISGSSFRISVMELTNTVCNFQGWATSGFNLNSSFWGWKILYFLQQ